MANYGPGDAESEISDAQMAMDPTRSECVRPTILDHYHRWMRAKSMTDKFMELDGLIRACLPHMTDPRAVKEVVGLLDDPILRQDILTKNTDKFLAGVSVTILEMNECWIRYPLLADIWDIVQKDLVRSGLLPWAMQYPDKILRGAFMQQVVDNIETLNFEAGPPPPARLPESRAPDRPTPTDVTERITDLLMRDSQANPRNVVDMRMRTDGDIEPPVVSNIEKHEPMAQVFIPDLEGTPDEKISEDGPSDDVMDASADAIKDFLEKRKKRVKHDR